MKGVKNRVRGCEAVAERIDISSKLSIYSLLDLHKLRWSVRGVTERQHAYPGQVLTTNMHCRFFHHHGFTIPRHIVHESSNNTMKRESAEVVCRWFLRGTHWLAFMQQRQVKPCRLVKR